MRGTPHLVARDRTASMARTYEASRDCVVTRLGLRTPFDLIRAYRDFHRIRAEARDLLGLVHSVFLIGGPRTCYIVSIWTGPGAIAEFGGRSTIHLAVARAVMGRLRMSPHGGPEMWSTKWRQAKVGPLIHGDALRTDSDAPDDRGAQVRVS